MFLRYELHNHTTESDARIDVKELLDIMVEEGVDAFAITDHNTISGHAKLQKWMEQEKPKLQGIYGMEYTTYYGHILCLNMSEYVPWENINRHQPERLFEAAAKTGAVIGIAHPFAYGDPIAQGCRWEMRIKDYHSFDFIEIINNGTDLEAEALPGILWWEDLVLQGYPIAMTAGMDLHGNAEMKGRFATYIDAAEGESAAEALNRGIRSQRTFVTKGPVFEAFSWNEGAIQGISCKLHPVVKKGFQMPVNKAWKVIFKTIDREIIRDYHETEGIIVPLEELGNAERVIVKLYESTGTSVHQLVAVSPVVELK